MRKQRGIALLMALVVLAIVATLAASMQWDRNLDIRRTANIINSDQAFAYALGAEAWARQILLRDARSSHTDNLGELWATQLPPMPVEGGRIIGHLEDMQSRFNLNDLVTPDGKLDTMAFKQFQRLLTVLDINPNIANAVVDWIDPDNTARFPAGAEDEVYSRETPPYLAANQPMVSITELHAIHGITPKIYAKLSPYVTALPASKIPINVNTASAPVLMSLADGISADTANQAIKERQQHGFTSLSAFETLIHINVPAKEISLSSSYFELTANVKIGTTRLTLYSLLMRQTGGATRVLRRSIGTM